MKVSERTQKSLAFSFAAVAAAVIFPEIASPANIISSASVLVGSVSLVIDNAKPADNWGFSSLT